MGSVAFSTGYRRPRMKQEVIYDPGEPVPVRRYASEVLAALDQALLEAADIPAFLRQSHFSETDPRTVLLVVRREDAAAALQLLDSPPSAGDASIEPPDDDA